MITELRPVNKRTWKAPVGCRTCGHVWEVESVVGERHFECPSCETPTGQWLSSVLPPPNTDVWGCSCGCIAFTVGVEGFFCLACGLMTSRADCKFHLN